MANINQIAIVVSVKSPLPDYYLLDKLLITVMQKGDQRSNLHKQN